MSATNGRSNNDSGNETAGADAGTDRVTRPGDRGAPDDGPLGRALADNDPLAHYLVDEFDKAWDIMVSENMSAAEFVAEHENTP